ncbi:hypothetical protein FWK35_00019933 [Aphis craccivora]|uniref:Uncharacterized protein n=1 Tax=Aphis craccivora TaxID=307492 RepID=A0A6G0YMS8_APHCR|nr:hypothetical protein FWK35_00019933 [Aphis craccivora]
MSILNDLVKSHYKKSQSKLQIHSNPLIKSLPILCLNLPMKITKTMTKRIAKYLPNA